MKLDGTHCNNYISHYLIYKYISAKKYPTIRATVQNLSEGKYIDSDVYIIIYTMQLCRY